MYIREYDLLNLSNTESGSNELRFSIDNHDTIFQPSQLFDKWHHCAITYDSSEKTLYCFLDGNLKTTYPNFPMPENNVQLWFGRSEYPSNLNWCGLYQLIRVSNTVKFKEDFDCYDLSVLNYPWPYNKVINNLKG